MPLVDAEQRGGAGDAESDLLPESAQFTPNRCWHRGALLVGGKPLLVTNVWLHTAGPASLRLAGLGGGGVRDRHP